MHACRGYSRHVPTCHALYRSCDVYSFIHTESHSFVIAHDSLSFSLSIGWEGESSRTCSRSSAVGLPRVAERVLGVLGLPHGPIRPCDEQLHHRGVGAVPVAAIGKALPAGEEAEDRSASCGGARRGGHRRGRGVARRAARPVEALVRLSLPARDVVSTRAREAEHLSRGGGLGRG